jgi:hypothetical protein
MRVRGRRKGSFTAPEVCNGHVLSSFIKTNSAIATVLVSLGDHTTPSVADSDLHVGDEPVV